MKNLFGFVFLGLAILIISLGNLSITGNVVKENFDSFVSLNFIIIGFLLAGILVFTTKKSLDAIIVPTSGEPEEDLERARRALEEETDYYLISGHLNKGEPIGKQSSATIYRGLRETEEMRKYGVNPKVKASKIHIEGKSRDTLENALYSFSKLKGKKVVGIVSYPLHLKRFKEIIDKAKEENRISKDIKIVYLPTKETFNEKLYGILGLVKEKYRLRHGIKEAQKHKTGWFGNLIKKIVNKA